MTMFWLGAGSMAVVAGLLAWAWSLEGPTVEADLLADEAAAKDYLANLEDELHAKLTEAELAGLTQAAASLTSLLNAVQAELGKLS
jgi:hypothetical protein